MVNEILVGDHILTTVALKTDSVPTRICIMNHFFWQIYYNFGGKTILILMIKQALVMKAVNWLQQSGQVKIRSKLQVAVS